MSSGDGGKLELVRSLLARVNGYQQARVQKLIELAGDASVRRFTRVMLRAAPVDSVILMQLASDPPQPIAAGDLGVDQNQSFVELSAFFSRNGIPVPRVLADNLEASVLLVEDVGMSALSSRLCDSASSSELHVSLYCSALDLIAKLQALSPDSSCIAYRRSLEASHYEQEAQRFVDHFLKPHGHKSNVIDAVEQILPPLAERIAAHPRALVHRDFMPWNIHIGADDRLWIIDFQDALLASHVYDVVSLLHDRDTDQLLGVERVKELYRYSRQCARSVEDFAREYCEVLLQRHLRLAGQFRLLSERSNRTAYEAWIPGSLCRIGIALSALSEYQSVASILAEAVPEIAEGVNLASGEGAWQIGRW